MVDDIFGMCLAKIFLLKLIQYPVDKFKYVQEFWKFKRFQDGAAVG